MCVKLHVACAVRSVRRAQEAGYGRAEHKCSCGEPLETRGLFGMRSDVVAACMVGIQQEGNESLPDGTVREGTSARSANSCHNVTGKVRGL